MSYFFSNDSILKIGHNLKYDIKVLAKYHMEVKGKLFDTMLAHYLANPDGRHSMDILSEKYLNYKPVSITELIGKKGKGQLNFRDVPLEKATEYAAEDADVTLQLHQKFNEVIAKSGLQKLYVDVEMPLVSVLADMEFEGVAVDVPFLQNYS